MEQDRSIDNLSNLLIQLQMTARLKYLSEQIGSKEKEFFEARQAELVAQVGQYEDEASETFNNLNEVATLRLEAGLGMYAVMLAQSETELTGEDKNYLHQTTAQIGHVALLIEGFGIYQASKETEAAVEEVEPAEPVVEQTVSAPEVEEKPVDFDIHFDRDNVLTINGKIPKFLPAQRFVFEAYLMTEGDFMERDIYQAAEFQGLLIELNQTSPPATAFANANTGVVGKLRKLGIERDLIDHVGGGTVRAKQLRLTDSIKITDERFDITFEQIETAVIASESELLGTYLFDNLEVGREADLSVIALDYFGLDPNSQLDERQQKIIDAAVFWLSVNIKSQGAKVKTRLDGDKRLVGIIDAATGEPKAVEKPRGDFVSLEKGKIVYQNETIDLTVIEQALVDVIPTNQHQPLTRANIRNKLRESGVNVSDFDNDFKKLRLKLGDKLVQISRKGNTFYYIDN